MITRRPQCRHSRRRTIRLSYILNNRFYIGDLIWNGETFQGHHKPLVDRATFDLCQDILNGKNRRIGKPQLALSGGLFTCAHCGHAVTGERIKKRLANGSHRYYTYYRCANNNPGSQHPRVRWREEALEQAILDDLATMRMPSDEIAAWFRTALQAAFADVTTQRQRQRQTLTTRRAELATMKERLLTGYLSGVIDEGTFQEKSANLSGQLNEVERALERCGDIDSSRGDIALTVFDWSQKATEAWRGSKMSEKRAILDAVSLNRTLSDVTLVTTKRKPFCYLAERPPVSSTRGDWHSFEPVAAMVERYVDAFTSSTPPYLRQLAEIARKPAWSCGQTLWRSAAARSAVRRMLLLDGGFASPCINGPPPWPRCSEDAARARPCERSTTRDKKHR